MISKIDFAGGDGSVADMSGGVNCGSGGDDVSVESVLCSAGPLRMKEQVARYLGPASSGMSSFLSGNWGG